MMVLCVLGCWALGAALAVLIGAMLPHGYGGLAFLIGVVLGFVGVQVGIAVSDRISR